MFEQKSWCTFFTCGEVRGGHRTGESGIPDGVGRQYDKMLTFRVGMADPGLGRGRGMQGDLGTEHRGQAMSPGRFSKAHDTVETVVVGERQGPQTKADRLFDQLLRVRCSIEKAEVGVTVQLSVGSTFTTRHSAFTTRHSAFTTRHSTFTTRHSTLTYRHIRRSFP